MSDILFLAHRAPFPPDRGDKIRSYHILRYLADRARVHLVAFGETTADLTSPPDLGGQLASCAIIPRTKSRAVAAGQALLTGRPVSLTAFADRRFAVAVARVRAKHAIGTAYIFSGQMAQYAGPERTIMDFVDVDSAKFAQLAEGSFGPMRWLLHREARLLSSYERRAAACADASLFVSEAEAGLFRSRGGDGHIATIENGIDAGFFNPNAPIAPVHKDGLLIVFTGQMDYRPNIDAVVEFATAALPKLRARHPSARFAIVGRAPTTRVLALAKRDGVLVTGAVEDVRPWLAAADVVVAPLRTARGVQNKVLEAMAMARPVVATPAAAQGIDHGGTIRVASGDCAAAVNALIEDRVPAEALGARARARVLSRYDWGSRLAPLDALLRLARPGQLAA